MAFLSSRTTIVILTLITTAIHLSLGILDFGSMLGKLFVLNAIGYVVLLYLTFWTPAFLSAQKRLVRWAFLAFVAVTFVMYFVSNGFNPNDFAGLGTKLVELLLFIGLLRSK